MLKTWQLQEAKNKLSEVIDKALEEGPQTLTRRGEEVVVIVSIEEFKKLVRPKDSFAEFIAKSPLKDIKLDLERKKDFGRKIRL